MSTTIAPHVSVTTPEVVDTRTADQIAADIVSTQQRLAGRVADLQAHVAPKAVASRQVNRVRDFYVDEFGGVRVDRVAASGAALAGLLLVRHLLRRRR